MKYAARVLFSLATALVQTVGSLDVVNARVAEGGLQKRAPLPLLVVDTVDCIEPVMPPKRRVVAGGVSHSQPKHRPRNEQTAAPVEKEREKVYTVACFVYHYYACFTQYASLQQCTTERSQQKRA